MRISSCSSSLYLRPCPYSLTSLLNKLPSHMPGHLHKPCLRIAINHSGLVKMGLYIEVHALTYVHMYINWFIVASIHTYGKYCVEGRNVGGLGENWMLHSRTDGKYLSRRQVMGLGGGAYQIDVFSYKYDKHRKKFAF